MSVRYLSCGDTAFTVEFGNEISPEINGRVMALHAAIGQAARDGALAGVVETVPTYRSLTVSYDPLKTSRAKLEPEIAGLINLVGTIRKIPASLGDGVKKVYDSELGPMKKLRRVSGVVAESEAARQPVTV